MTLTNREHTRVPDTTFRVRVDGQWQERSRDDLFAEKTVVVFALPGAFTPTCSSNHVPRYQQLAPALFAHGVDDILCVSVNDAFVMDAWQVDEGADRIRFIPDGNGEFTRAMGMLVDKQELGFGPRSWRYSMLVRDGVIEKMFIEPEVEGDPFEVSDADTMLNYVAGEGHAPPSIVVFTKPGCEYCVRAKRSLAEAGYEYDEIESTQSMRLAVAGHTSTPQVFIDGVHVGGATELEAWVESSRPDSPSHENAA